MRAANLACGTYKTYALYLRTVRVVVDKEAPLSPLISPTIHESFRSHPEFFSTPHSTIAETCLSCLNSHEVKALSTSPTPDLQRALFLASQRVLLLTSNTCCFSYILLCIGPFRLHRIPYAYDRDNTAYPLKSSRTHRNHIFSVLILVHFPYAIV